MTVSYNSKRKSAKTKKRLAMMTVEEYKMLKPEELKGHKRIIDFMKDNEIRPRLTPNKVVVKETTVIKNEKIDSMGQYKKFEVTFTEKSKYNSITRTVEVLGFNNYHAEMLTHQLFGSFKSTQPMLVPSNRIKVDSCVEVKEDIIEDIVELVSK